MKKENIAKMGERARRQIAMLTVIFLAGMAVNVIGMPDETTGTIMNISAVLTGLHALIGIGLIAGSVIALRIAYKEARSFTTLAWAACVSLVISFATGVMMMVAKSGWWSFIMAASFLAALLLYGAILVRAQKA